MLIVVITVKKTKCKENSFKGECNAKKRKKEKVFRMIMIVMKRKLISKTEKN
jgi:hypothetical protein